jgi:hypothetical protein
MQVVDGFIISALFPVFALGASIGAAVAAWKQRRATARSDGCVARGGCNGFGSLVVSDVVVLHDLDLF